MKKIFLLCLALFVLKDATAQWIPIIQDTIWYHNYSIYFRNVNTGYAMFSTDLTGYGYLIKTTDGGTNWFVPSGDTTWGGGPVYFINDSTGYFGGMKTYDGGLTWEYQNFGAPGTINSICFLNEDTGFTVGSGINGFPGSHYKFIAKTSDGGSTWVTIISQQNPNICYNSVCFTDDYTGYIVGDEGVVIKTIDGGVNWSEQSSGTNDHLYKVIFPATDTGYIIGSHIVLKTVDGGSNWSPLSFNANDYLLDACFINVNTGYIVGCYGVILKTIDGGLSWSDQADGMWGGACFESVFFPVADTGYIGGGSIVLKTVNGGAPVGFNEVVPATNQLSISPNPSKEMITIKGAMDGIISVINLDAKLILQREISAQSQLFNISGLHDGIYFVKVVGKDGIQVGKFIKQ